MQQAALQHKGNSGALVKRLLRDYVVKHRGRIALAVFCMIIAAGTTAAHAWIMQPVLDEIFVSKDTQMLALIPLAIAAIAVISGVANYFQTILMRFVGQRVIADMQMDLFSHLMRADLGSFHDQSSGRLISRFTNDIQMMRHSISNVLTGIAKETLTFIFLVGVMVYQSWQLSLIAFLVFPVAILPVVRLGRRMRKIADATQIQLGEFTNQLDDIFKGAREVKAYGREAYETERARGGVEGLFKLYYKASRVQAAASPMMETLGGFAIAAVIWYGGYKVINGVTTPGAFFSFMTAMIMAYRPIKAMAGLNTHLQEGLAAANRFFAMIDTEPGIKDKPDAKALQVEKGEIQFSDVTFRYREEGGGVEGVSLHVPAGKTVALVGPSGGGKSTIMNLLLRFYEAQSGSITIDGQALPDVTMASLRRHIALVSQETILFDDTVRNNIAYGLEDASEEAIIEAAKHADAHEFITRMPEGYDTMIGPHGVRLSGGQRQRLSIARAMLKNAPILLLDEATSALDSTSERAVQQALEHLMQNRTTLVIAHRLSTIQHADCIYVLEHGRVAEHGPHAELLARGGLYATLHHTQFAPHSAAAEA